MRGRKRQRFHKVGSASLYDFASQGFKLSSFRLAIYPFTLSTTRGFSGFPSWGCDGDAFDQFLEPCEGIVPILLLGTVLLGFDHDDPVFSDAAIAQIEEAFFVEWRQGRCVDVETQMDGSGDFIDILAACALRANRSNVDFSERNGGFISDLQQRKASLKHLVWPRRSESDDEPAPQPVARSFCRPFPS